MSNHYDQSLRDRLSLASEAKKKLLAKFKSAMVLDDPTKIEKRREREAIVAARAQRAQQRETARQLHEIKLSNQAAIAAEVAAEAKRAADEQVAREAAEKVEREALLQAEQKTIRDARYAARKAAKKVRRRGY
jgi:hypothetical protein